MSKRIALIVIGRFKDDWQQLTATQQNDFVERVGKVVQTFGLHAVTAYHLTSTPGAFIQIWEAGERSAIDNAVKNLDALGYTKYIDARWMIGERETAEA
jgi:hypothetical protein